MSEGILVIHQGVTGFTKAYAEMIAEELGARKMTLKEAASQTLSGFDTIVFGGRVHAGMVDGLKKAKALFAGSEAKRLVVFAVGAMPGSEEDTVAQMWKNNLTPEEIGTIAHFYMQGGLCYERMPLGDKLMMKMFAAVMKRKKDKSETEKGFAEAIASSYDISSRDFIRPLVLCLQEGRENAQD